MKHEEKETDWELDCLASDIRKVEMCKKEKPELYAKALKKLKKEAKQIMSIEDLKERVKELEDGDE